MFTDNDTNNESDFELVVTDGVPETSSEEIEQVETDVSEEVNQVQDNSTQELDESTSNNEEIERQIEERANKLVEERIEARLARDRSSRERKEAPQKAKYEELTNIMKTALGAKDLDDVISKSREFYKEQGIIIPEPISQPAHSEREERILAKADAGDIIKSGKEEMEAEANRIAAIPKEQRSFRDKIIFEEVCQELMNLKDIESLKAKGYDTKILDDKDFSLFREQFNISTPISKVYEMYQTVHGAKKTQPRSPGSAKTTTTNNEIKEYYTPEEVKKFTEEDLDNPKLMAAIEKSMQSWGKTK